MSDRENQVRVQTQMDDLCRQYARHLADGGTPAIADYVNRVSEAHRDELRRRLVALARLLSTGADDGAALDETVTRTSDPITREKTRGVFRALEDDAVTPTVDAAPARGPQPTREYALVPRRSRCSLRNMRARGAHLAA